MLAKNILGSLLLAVLTNLAVLPARRALGQTGVATGEVRLCSLDRDNRGQAKEEPRDGIAVTMVNTKSTGYNKSFTWDKCDAPDIECKTVYTDSDGGFTAIGLHTTHWIFRAFKDGYLLKEPPREISIINGPNRVPPRPLWLRERKAPKCPGESNASSAFRTGRESDTAASAHTDDSEGGGYIVFILYKKDAKTPTPRKEQKKITLKGKVVDTTHRPLAGASVFITDANETAGQSPLMGDAITHETDKRTGTAKGDFSIDITADLEEGAYLFSVKLESFEPLVMSLNEAIAALRRDGTIILRREDELSGYETRLIEMTEATRRSVFTPEVMQTLPVPGTRSFDEFALLAPGVLPPPETFGGVGPGVSAGVGRAGQFSVNGLRSRENNFTVDGSDNNDEDIGTRRQGFVMTVPQPVESVQELQIITALGDARFGRNIGGQINVLTKTGGLGRFHGSLYAYVTDSHLNPRDPFDQSATDAPPAFTPRRASDGAPVLLDGTPLALRNTVGGEDAFRRVQLGLAAGGQLPHYDKTFYFLSAERQDTRADKESHFAVPTVRQRGAFESGETGLLLVRANAATLYPASVPGDAVFSLYPFPNNPRGPYGENTYSTVLPADGHGTRFSFKLDRQFKGQPPDASWWRTIFRLKAHIDQLTGRYNFTDELSTLPVTGGALFSSLRPKVRTQNLAFFVNRALSPSTADTIRFSFGRTRLSFGERRDASLLASSALPDVPFLLNAPLMLNVTRPIQTVGGTLNTPCPLPSGGTMNAPCFFSATGTQGAALLSSLGYQGVTQTEQITGPLGQVFIAGFSPAGVDVENFPQERANNTYQLADTITSLHKNNVFTFGVDVRKTRINSTLDRNFRPRAVFNGLPGATFADTLALPGGEPLVSAGVPLTGATLAAAGVPTGLFQALATIPDSFIAIHFTQVNLFWQDQLRLRRNFHVTAGVRYEFNTVPDTVGQRLERAFDPEELRTQAQQAVNFCNNSRCNDLVGALTSAFPADFKVSFGADRTDLDARLGFAWTPFDNTSIRGGFGTYSGQYPGIVIDQSRNAFSDFLPLNLANFSPRSGNQTFLFNLANPALRQLSPDLNVITQGTLNEFASANPIALLANQFFNLGELSLAPTVLGLDLVLPQRKLKTPYALQYGLTVEHQFRNDYLLSVAYVGTRGVKLLRVSTPDLGLNDSRFAGPVSVDPLTTGQPLPFFQGQIRPPQTNLISQSFTIARTFFESSAQSVYNSLQVEFRKRYSHAFLVGSAFTYSHSIDDASDFFDNAGAFVLPQDSLRRDERASSNFDVRLRSATHFVVDLQKEWFGAKRWKGSRKEWFGRVLGGFQLGGIFTAQGGQPYTVNSALDINRDGNLTDRLNTTAGILREPSGGRVQLRLAPGLSTRDLLAPDGLDGSVGRNTFRAPGLYTFDCSVTETINFKEHSRFIIRTEFFNLFNWANYGTPVRILESPAFGTSVNTRTPSRTIQLVGKFQF
jgi:hypothetical protein